VFKPFAAVYVDYAIPRGARVTWLMTQRFWEPPHEFQLQRRFGDGEWHNVGQVETNRLRAYDDEPCPSRVRDTLYRIKLTTPKGVYFSEPATTLGKLTYAQWLQVKEMVRRIQLPGTQPTMNTFPGVLLRQQMEGPQCQYCIDPYTGGVTNSDCTYCHGTGYLPGYWIAGEHVMSDMHSLKTASQQHPSTGTTTPAAMQGQFAGLPLVYPGDVWVSHHCDYRYRVDNISHVACMNKVPFVVNATLQLLPHSDAVYRINTR
jgi:hypothetical protein